jgi:hypothetical protein
MVSCVQGSAEPRRASTLNPLTWNYSLWALVVGCGNPSRHNEIRDWHGCCQWSGAGSGH